MLLADSWISSFLKIRIEYPINFFVGISDKVVLANMKGPGIPFFEFDFPSGSDMLGDIKNGPMAAQRMEFELFSRLAAE